MPKVDWSCITGLQEVLMNETEEVLLFSVRVMSMGKDLVGINRNFLESNYFACL